VGLFIVVHEVETYLVFRFRLDRPVLVPQMNHGRHCHSNHNADRQEPPYRRNPDQQRCQQDSAKQEPHFALVPQTAFESRFWPFHTEIVGQNQLYRGDSFV